MVIERRNKRSLSGTRRLEKKNNGTDSMVNCPTGSKMLLYLLMLEAYDLRASPSELYTCPQLRFSPSSRSPELEMCPCPRSQRPTPSTNRCRLHLNITSYHRK